MSMIESHTKRLNAQHDASNSSSRSDESADRFSLAGLPVENGDGFIPVAKQAGIPIRDESGRRIA